MIYAPISKWGHSDVTCPQIGGIFAAKAVKSVADFELSKAGRLRKTAGIDNSVKQRCRSRLQGNKPRKARKGFCRRSDTCRPLDPHRSIQIILRHADCHRMIGVISDFSVNED